MKHLVFYLLQQEETQLYVLVIPNKSHHIIFLLCFY